MVAWRHEAVVWFNDEKRGKVLAGSYGFAWWEDKMVFIGAHAIFQGQPVMAFQQFQTWSEVRSFPILVAPLSAIMRFVRTGLPPVQGRLRAD